MSNLDLGKIALTLLVLLVAAHVFAYAAERLRQPRLVGEILAGALLGPFVLGQLAPEAFAQLFGGAPAASASPISTTLNLAYSAGLFLLMFLSGSETRRLMARENLRETLWFVTVGTALPLGLTLVAGASGALPLDRLVGARGNETSVLLVLAIAVAVTSIPVISRIFMDLRIMHTRFASLVLGFAVVEDIILWGFLAVATHAPDAGGLVRSIATHVGVTFAYMAVGLLVAPAALKRLHASRWNLLVRASPVGYIVSLFFAYVAIAAALDVNLVFAAFLAGFGLVGGMKGTERARFSPQLEAVSKVALGTLVPIYFAMVGFRLDLGRDFSLPMLAVFLAGSSLVAMASFSVASRLAGFRGLDILNLAITKNARGGPGIVLASVAFEAGLINAAFYTTLVLTAVVTSQAAGVWLRSVLARGRPLLSAHPEQVSLPGGALPT